MNIEQDNQGIRLITERGQSATIGIILLFALVMISATTVVVIGSESISTVESRSEAEYTKNEIREVSHDISTISTSRQGSRYTSIKDRYRVTKGANLEVCINSTKGDSSCNVHEIKRLQKGDFMYEGGLLVREDKVVQSPQVGISEDSTLLTIPQVTGTQFNGEVEYVGSNKTSIGPDDQVNIYIESSLYEEWYRALSALDPKIVNDNVVHVSFGEEPKAVSQDVTHSISLTGEGAVSLGTFGTFNLVNDETTIASPNQIHLAQGGGGNTNYNIPGKIISGKEIKPSSVHKDNGGNSFSNIDETEEYADVPEPVSSDKFMPSNPEKWEKLEDWKVSQGEYETNSNSLSDGEYHISGNLTSTTVNFKVSNSTLYIGGDLDLRQSNIEMDDDVTLYVDGDVRIGSGNFKKTSIFTTGDQIRFDSASYNGLIYGTEAELYIKSSLDMKGVMMVSNLKSDKKATLNFEYNDSVTGERIEGKKSGESGAIRKGSEKYLQIRIPQIKAS